MTLRRLVAQPWGPNAPATEILPGGLSAPIVEIDDITGIIYVGGIAVTGGGGGGSVTGGPFAAGNAAIGAGGGALVDSHQALIPVSSFDSTEVLSLASGDNPLYTVPTGKLAFMRIEGINPTVGTITIFPTLTPNGGAVINRVASNAVVAASPGNSGYDYQLSPYLLGSAGDVLGMNCTALGLNAHVEVVLLDINNVGVWKQILLKTFIIGDNTVYTVPAGKTAYLGYGNFLFFGTIGTQFMYSNQSGGNATIKVNFVPSGGSPSAANMILSPAATVDNGFVNFVTIKRLVAGDFININTTSNGKQLFAAFVLETTP